MIAWRGAVLATGFLAGACLHAETTAWKAVSLSSQGGWTAVQEKAGDAWLIHGTTGRRQRLAHYTGDAVAFDWATDDRRVAVDHAGSIQVFDTAAGNLRYKLEGTSAAFAPDGKTLSFIRGHNLWIAAINGKHQRPLTSTGGTELLEGDADPVYAHEFDASRQFWWAPDSSSIAYIETAYPDPDHYPLPGKKLPLFRLKCMDLKTGQPQTIFETNDAWQYLLRVAWSPDSKRLLFYRMNRLQNRAELCIWDGGSVQTILVEKDAYWVDAPATPLFVSGGKQILVTSNREGNRHIYAYTINGSLLHDLTPGDMEVNRLYPGNLVSAGVGSKQDQQLFSLDLRGGAPRQLTLDPGWHEIEVARGGKVRLDIYSSARRPPVITRNGRTLWRAPGAVAPVGLEFRQIAMHDGTLLPARWYHPRDFSPVKKYPVLVYTYSGPHGRVVRDAWGGWEMDWNRAMTQRGFLVLAVDLRGSTGYGHAFQEPIHYRLGAQEIADLREVVDYLGTLPFVDRSRMGIWGNEYGGHIAVHAMLEVPGGFKAGFALAPIVDWRRYDAYFTERYLGPPMAKGIDYDDSSALDSARRMTGTLLVGKLPNDPIVSSDHIAALQRRISKVQKANAASHFATIEAGNDLQEHMTAFFSQMLQ